MLVVTTSIRDRLLDFVVVFVASTARHVAVPGNTNYLYA